MTSAAEPSVETSRLVPVAAPLDYRAMRATFQRVRAAAAVLLLALAVVSVTASSAAGWLRVGLFSALLIDAVIRTRTEGSILGSIGVDVLCGAFALGASDHPEAPLAILVAYVIVLTIMVAGTKVLPLILAGALGAIAVRYVVLQPLYKGDGFGETTTLVSWMETGVILVAVAILLMEGAAHLHAAKARQIAALESERRASDMKNEFVSMVSHELRTPLTNISGFAIAARESWQALPPEEVDEFLGIIMSEAEHLQNLVDDVLAIPRLEAGRLLLEPVDFELRPAAFRIADLLFPPGGDKEATVQIGGSVVVYADPNRVEQVLRNLLENARKYGGDHVTVDASPSDEGYTIVVADNGLGVPEEFRDKIFDQFEQVSRGDARSSSGIGLGLTITQRLIEAMGGRVWYEPGFPVGARFCFSLPAAQGVRSEADADADATTR